VSPQAEGILRTLVGLGMAVFALYWGWTKLPKMSLPSLKRSTENHDLADMQAVLALAARLKEAGKVEAVKLCQQLIDEMLKQPKANKT